MHAKRRSTTRKIAELIFAPRRSAAVVSVMSIALFLWGIWWELLLHSDRYSVGVLSGGLAMYLGRDGSLWATMHVLRNGQGIPAAPELYVGGGEVSLLIPLWMVALVCVTWWLGCVLQHRSKRRRRFGFGWGR